MEWADVRGGACHMLGQPALQAALQQTGRHVQLRPTQGLVEGQTRCIVAGGISQHRGKLRKPPGAAERQVAAAGIERLAE